MYGEFEWGVSHSGPLKAKTTKNPDSQKSRVFASSYNITHFNT
jgi:hypothetical protein